MAGRLTHVFSSSKNNRRLAILHDLAMIPVAWLGAYWLSFNLGAIPENYLQGAADSLLVVVLIQGLVFRYFGLYRGVWRFASMPDLIRISKAVVVGMAFSATLLFLIASMDALPRSVFPLYGLLLISLLGTSRLVVRWSKDRGIYGEGAKRVLIVGAGRAGEMLVRDLLRGNEELYRPVGFLDDNINKQGREIHGVRVLGTSCEIVDFADRMDIDLIVLAIPSADSADMRRLVGFCERTNVPFRTLPPLDRLMSGQVTLSNLREVSIDDLLGREPVSLDWKAIRQELKRKIVLVTGAGGSIGSELCRQIARLKPAKLLLLDNSEFNLYRIEKELKQEFPELNLGVYLNDVSDLPAVGRLMQDCGPQIIFHAAAYKHVPMLEDKIREAVQNNILGTQAMAMLADRFACEAFVMISTDKAVNPANVMGASKRAAEVLSQNLNKRSKTRFITVRFGNVLGSTGSVVPLFQEQIISGGPVTVTHREITRYFMTISESCQLILQASVMGEGGEIYVLDMGQPIKIDYLAQQMIRLSGKVPGKDIDIVYTGLRPGEKLFEELFHEKEALQSTGHKKILLARYREVDWNSLNECIGNMRDACEQFNRPRLKILLKQLVPEWNTNIIASVDTKKNAIALVNQNGDSVQELNNFHSKG